MLLSARGLQLWRMRPSARFTACSASTDLSSQCHQNRAILCSCGSDFTAPQKVARAFEVPRCAISSAKKVASEPRFLPRRKWAKMVFAAEFPAIPSSAAKIASERRCAILMHSDIVCPQDKPPVSQGQTRGFLLIYTGTNPVCPSAAEKFMC